MAKISRLGNCHPDFFFPGAHPALPVPAPLMLDTIWALSCYKSYQMLAFFYQHLFQNRKGIGILALTKFEKQLAFSFRQVAFNAL